MIGSVSLVLWTAVILPFVYGAYNFIVFYLDVRRRAKYINKFPGIPPHPLWGHLGDVPREMNEVGLAFLLGTLDVHPKIEKFWYGPFLPTVGVTHPETIKSLLKTSGPNEAGLKFMRERGALYPRMGKFWYGPFLPSISVVHPETVKEVLKTSGVVWILLVYPGSYSFRIGRTSSPLSLVELFPGPGEAGLTWIKERAYSWNATGAVKVFFGPFVPGVSVFHPSTVKTMLKTSEPKPWNVGGYRLIYPWLGDGLLLSKGSKWNRNRRLLTPAFHFDILKPYMTVNNRCAEVFLNKLDKFAKTGESFEVFTHISLLTLDVILRCAFSYDNDCQIRGGEHPYVKAVNDLQEMAVYRILSPWLYPDVIFNLTPGGRKFQKNCDFVHSVSQDIMDKRKLALAAGEVPGRVGRYLDFLDILLTAKDDNGTGLTNLEIRDEVDTFLFEGHDTTASGVSWTLFSLAANPEIQKKCQEEIDEILNGRDSDEILWDDLPKLKYLTMCIKEALRLHTPVPFIERQTTKDMYLDGLLLPAGTVVDIHLYVLHHNPTVWDQPMEYRPERFLPENMEKMDSYAFVPFSAGPRNCIGQHFAMHEMKSIIARILRGYELSLDPNHTVGHKIVVVMKTETGMYMKASQRKH